MGTTCVKGSVDETVVSSSRGDQRGDKKSSHSVAGHQSRRSGVPSCSEAHRRSSSYSCIGVAPRGAMVFGATDTILSSLKDDMLSIPSLHRERLTPLSHHTGAASHAGACRINVKRVAMAAASVDATSVFNGNEYLQRHRVSRAATSKEEITAVSASEAATLVGDGGGLNSVSGDAGTLTPINEVHTAWSIGALEVGDLGGAVSARFSSSTLFSCRSFAEKDPARCSDLSLHSSSLPSITAGGERGDSLDANRKSGNACLMQRPPLFVDPCSKDVASSGNKHSDGREREGEKREEDQLDQQMGRTLVYEEMSQRNCIENSEDDVWKVFLSQHAEACRSLLQKVDQSERDADVSPQAAGPLEDFSPGTAPLIVAAHGKMVQAHNDMTSDRCCTSAASGGISEDALKSCSARPARMEGLYRCAPFPHQATRTTRRRRRGGGLVPPAPPKEVLAVAPLRTSSSEGAGGSCPHMCGLEQLEREGSHSASHCSPPITGSMAPAHAAYRSRLALRGGSVGVDGAPRSGEKFSHRLLPPPPPPPTDGSRERQLESPRIVHFERLEGAMHSPQGAGNVTLAATSRQPNDGFPAYRLQNVQEWKCLPGNCNMLLSPFPPTTSSSSPPPNVNAKIDELDAERDIFTENGCNVGQNPSPMQCHHSTYSPSVCRPLYSPKVENVPTQCTTVLNGSRSSTRVGFAPITCNEVDAVGAAVGGGGHRRCHARAGKHVCQWCGELYESRKVCSVAHETHAELRQRRRREKQVKKQVQALLRCGRIREAILQLEANGLI